MSRHVVFGGGQVGSTLARLLVEAGHEVRLVRRGAGVVPEGVEGRRGDALDPAFVREACAGAAVVYDCLNPGYVAATWVRELPRLREHLIAGAGAAGARLVVLDNLYSVGRPDGPITAGTPDRPISPKGEVRARIAARLLEAHRHGEVEAVSGRASDFYGPGGYGTHFGEAFWRPALRGKPASFLPRADTPHTYHFIPDVARGLRTLGTAPEDSCGRAWMLPCAPAEPSLALIARFGRALGREIRPQGLPGWAIRPLGWFSPVVRELAEMLYEWEVPFTVDDSAFRAAFGVTPTDPDVGAAATVAWAREAFVTG